jgi:carbon storage regulator
MLVFRRQAGESFQIGNDVEVRVLRVQKGYVKIGVIAPRQVQIYRTEIAGFNKKAVISDWTEPTVEKTLKDLAGRLRSRK